MAGASRERENPTDVRCQHCRRYFSAQGIDSHEENCEVRSAVEVLVDRGVLEADPLVEDGGGQGSTPAVKPEDDEGAGGQPLEGGSPGTPAVTDGGSRSPPSFEADEDSAPVAGDGAGGDDVCGECGSPDWFDPAALPEAVLDEAPQIAEFDRACLECSTDDDGQLAAEIEVYNV